MSSHRTRAPYSRPEELAHSLTAGLGIVACAIAIPWLAWVAAGDRRAGSRRAGVRHQRARDVHDLGDLPLGTRPGAQAALRKLDHSAIYLLIAGTYTPFTLVAMRGAWGWALFGVVWTLAVLGIVAKTTVGFRFPRLSTLLYLGMGWLVVVAIKPLREPQRRASSPGCSPAAWCTPAGVPFYVWKSRRYTHAVWHLFVLGGVACHFAAVLSLVERTPRLTALFLAARRRASSSSSSRGAFFDRRCLLRDRFLLRRGFFFGRRFGGVFFAAGLLRAACFFAAGFCAPSAAGRCASSLAAQLIDDGRILERRQILRDVLVARDGAQQPAHDLARARLRQVVGEADVVGPRDGA